VKIWLKWVQRRRRRGPPWSKPAQFGTKDVEFTPPLVDFEPCLPEFGDPLAKCFTATAGDDRSERDLSFAIQVAE
jgi:hypothetical protein